MATTKHMNVRPSDSSAGKRYGMSMTTRANKKEMTTPPKAKGCQSCSKMVLRCARVIGNLSTWPVRIASRLALIIAKVVDFALAAAYSEARRRKTPEIGGIPSLYHPQCFKLSRGTQAEWQLFPIPFSGRCGDFGDVVRYVRLLSSSPSTPAQVRQLATSSFSLPFLQ